jgi:hypothetical protein
VVEVYFRLEELKGEAGFELEYANGAAAGLEVEPHQQRVEIFAGGRRQEAKLVEGFRSGAAHLLRVEVKEDTLYARLDDGALMSLAAPQAPVSALLFTGKGDVFASLEVTLSDPGTDSTEE